MKNVFFEIQQSKKFYALGELAQIYQKTNIDEIMKKEEIQKNIAQTKRLNEYMASVQTQRKKQADLLAEQMRNQSQQQQNQGGVNQQGLIEITVFQKALDDQNLILEGMEYNYIQIKEQYEIALAQNQTEIQQFQDELRQSQLQFQEELIRSSAQKNFEIDTEIGQLNAKIDEYLIYISNNKFNFLEVAKNTTEIKNLQFKIQQLQGQKVSDNQIESQAMEPEINQFDIKKYIDEQFAKLTQTEMQRLWLELSEIENLKQQYKDSMKHIDDFNQGYDKYLKIIEGLNEQNYAGQLKDLKSLIEFYNTNILEKNQQINLKQQLHQLKLLYDQISVKEKNLEKIQSAIQLYKGDIDTFEQFLKKINESKLIVDQDSQIDQLTKQLQQMNISQAALKTQQTLMQATNTQADISDIQTQIDELKAKQESYLEIFYDYIKKDEIIRLIDGAKVQLNQSIQSIKKIVDSQQLQIEKILTTQLTFESQLKSFNEKIQNLNSPEEMTEFKRDIKSLKEQLNELNGGALQKIQQSIDNLQTNQIKLDVQLIQEWTYKMSKMIEYFLINQQNMFENAKNKYKQLQDQIQKDQFVSNYSDIHFNLLFYFSETLQRRQLQFIKNAYEEFIQTQWPNEQQILLFIIKSNYQEVIKKNLKLSNLYKIEGVILETFQKCFQNLNSFNPSQNLINYTSAELPVLTRALISTDEFNELKQNVAANTTLLNQVNVAFRDFQMEVNEKLSNISSVTALQLEITNLKNSYDNQQLAIKRLTQFTDQTLLGLGFKNISIYDETSIENFKKDLYQKYEKLNRFLQSKVYINGVLQQNIKFFDTYNIDFSDITKHFQIQRGTQSTITPNNISKNDFDILKTEVSTIQQDLTKQKKDVKDQIDAIGKRIDGIKNLVDANTSALQSQSAIIDGYQNFYTVNKELGLKNLQHYLEQIKLIEDYIKSKNSSQTFSQMMVDLIVFINKQHNAQKQLNDKLDENSNQIGRVQQQTIALYENAVQTNQNQSSISLQIYEIQQTQLQTFRAIEMLFENNQEYSSVLYQLQGQFEISQTITYASLEHLLTNYTQKTELIKLIDQYNNQQIALQNLTQQSLQMQTQLDNQQIIVNQLQQDVLKIQQQFTIFQDNYNQTQKDLEDLKKLVKTNNDYLKNQISQLNITVSNYKLQFKGLVVEVSQSKKFFFQLMESKNRQIFTTQQTIQQVMVEIKKYFTTPDILNLVDRRKNDPNQMTQKFTESEIDTLGKITEVEKQFDQLNELDQNMKIQQKEIDLEFDQEMDKLAEQLASIYQEELIVPTQFNRATTRNFIELQSDKEFAIQIYSDGVKQMTDVQSLANHEDYIKRYENNYLNKKFITDSQLQEEEMGNADKVPVEKDTSPNENIPFDLIVRNTDAKQQIQEELNELTLVQDATHFEEIQAQIQLNQYTKKGGKQFTSGDVDQGRIGDINKLSNVQKKEELRRRSKAWKNAYKKFQTKNFDKSVAMRQTDIGVGYEKLIDTPEYVLNLGRSIIDSAEQVQTKLNQSQQEAFSALTNKAIQTEKGSRKEYQAIVKVIENTPISYIEKELMIDSVKKSFPLQPKQSAIAYQMADAVRDMDVAITEFFQTPELQRFINNEYIERSMLNSSQDIKEFPKVIFGYEASGYLQDQTYDLGPLFSKYKKIARNKIFETMESKYEIDLEQEKNKNLNFMDFSEEQKLAIVKTIALRYIQFFALAFSYKTYQKEAEVLPLTRQFTNNLAQSVMNYNGITAGAA